MHNPQACSSRLMGDGAGGREFLHVLTERGTDKEFMRARTKWVPETYACRTGA